MRSPVIIIIMIIIIIIQLIIITIIIIVFIFMKYGYGSRLKARELTSGLREPPEQCTVGLHCAV